MPAPLGFYSHRNDPGLRGVLARWWYRRRSRLSREALKKLREERARRARDERMDK